MNDWRRPVVASGGRLLARAAADSEVEAGQGRRWALPCRGRDDTGPNLNYREVVLLALISVAAALVFYLPFWIEAPSINNIPFAGQGMIRVHGMWDEPLFVTAAATLWDADPANPYYAWLDAPPSEYAERFPLYPLLIRLFAPLFGYWNSALIINVVVSTAVTLFLYAFLRRFGTLPAAAFWVALISIFWPPRGFLYRYAGMSDPLFLLGLIGAVYFFRTSRFTLCGLFGAIAVASRPNAAMVVMVFGLLALWRLASCDNGRLREVLRMAGMTLMPLTLAAIYLWHQIQFDDWLASVHASTFISPELTLYPSLLFFGVGSEGVPYLFLILLAGILELVRRREWDLVLLCSAFYLPVVFTPSDVSRYLLAIFPFAFFYAGERLLASTPVRIAALASVPIVYIYAWTTLLHRWYQAPFEDLWNMLS